MKFRTKTKISLILMFATVGILTTAFSTYIITSDVNEKVSVTPNSIQITDTEFLSYDDSNKNYLIFDVVKYTNSDGSVSTYYVDDNCEVKLQFLQEKYLQSTENSDFGMKIDINFGNLNTLFIDHVKEIIDDGFFSMKYRSLVTGNESELRLDEFSRFSGGLNYLPYSFSNNQMSIHVPFASEHSYGSVFYLQNLVSKFGIRNTRDLYLYFDFQFVDPNFGYLVFMDNFNPNEIGITITVEQYL